MRCLRYPTRCLAIMLIMMAATACGRRAKVDSAMARVCDEGDLTFCEYTLKGIISYEDSYLLAEKKIAYGYRAYVKAGINMGEYDPSKTKVTDSRTISLVLPPVRIQSVDTPMKDFVPLSEHTNAFSFGFSPEDRNRIKEEGEKEARKRAAELDVVKDAEQNCRQFFTAMLESLGYETVIISFEDRRPLVRND